MFNRMFKARKAVEAAGVLLRAEHGSMSYLRLLKLLHIADRESLQETGRPILGGVVVAMDRGPLHGAVYDLVKGERGGTSRSGLSSSRRTATTCG